MLCFREQIKSWSGVFIMFKTATVGSHKIPKSFLIGYNVMISKRLSPNTAACPDMMNGNQSIVVSNRRRKNACLDGEWYRFHENPARAILPSNLSTAERRAWAGSVNVENCRNCLLYQCFRFFRTRFKPLAMSEARGSIFLLPDSLTV